MLYPTIIDRVCSGNKRFAPVVGSKEAPRAIAKSPTSPDAAIDELNRTIDRKMNNIRCGCRRATYERRRSRRSEQNRPAVLEFSS